MGRDWGRATYRPGEAEELYALSCFYRGELTDEVLSQAETLARGGRNRATIRSLHGLRGEWYLGCDQPALAVKSLSEAIRMTREVGQEDANLDAMLALARFRVRENFDGRDEAEKLGNAVGLAALSVAELWCALGERDRAVEHGLLAHNWAVADGEPYVHRYYLDRVRALLTNLGVSLPQVPHYDPSRLSSNPWEEKVRAFIKKLRAKLHQGQIAAF